MNTTIPSQKLDVKYAGLAVECGTLSVLLDATLQQSVMVMPLTRTIQKEGLIVHQWILHITTRRNTQSPVYYASLRAAEVVQRATGFALTNPDRQPCPEGLQRGQLLQQQLQICVTELLSYSARVSQVIAPARFRISPVLQRDALRRTGFL
jgi:hypothetical protein